MKKFILLGLVLAGLVGVALFNQPPVGGVEARDNKVNVCHTGNGKNWVSVKVDKDAWDEHTSAHSDHEFDFLVDEEHPCPPEGGEPITTCDVDLPDELLKVDATRTISNNLDSGENGNFWAKDNFTQRMRIWEVKNGESKFYCAQTNDDGTFDALAGEESPGINSPVILTGNEDGTFYGGAKWKVTGHFDADWPTSGNVGSFDCSIDGQCPGYSKWLANYFGREYSANFVTWGWHYKSCGHGAWNNTDSGNSGDIVPGPTDEVCTKPNPEPQPNPEPKPLTPAGPPVCTDGNILALPLNFNVLRAGDKATLAWIPTGGNLVNIYFKEVGQPKWTHAVGDLPNNGNFVIDHLVPATGYDFAVQQHQGCAGGQLVEAVVHDGPAYKPVLFKFSYWQWSK